MTMPNPRIPFPRLLGAPVYNWFAIGQVGRERFNNGDRTAYTIEQYAHDQAQGQTRPISFAYDVNETPPPILTLENPQDVANMITRHFHPLDWPQYSKDTEDELLRLLLPLSNLIHPQIDVYERDRWFPGEDEQRAAETLSYRLRNGLVLRHSMVLSRFA